MLLNLTQHALKLNCDAKKNEQKGRVVSYAFTVLAVGFVLSFFLSIGYYNYLMIAPYVVPMLMALLVAMPLAFIRDAFIASIASAEHSLGFSQRPLLSNLCAIIVPLVSILIGAGTSTLLIPTPFTFLPCGVSDPLSRYV